MEIGKSLRKFARIRQIARFIMVQDPLASEINLSADKTSRKIKDILGNGNSVIKVKFPGEDAQYIVQENGTTYTTPIRPQWANDKDIILKRFSKPRPKLLPRLKKLCEELQKDDLEAFDALNIGAILESISSYYEKQGTSKAVDEVRLSNLLSRLPLDGIKLSQSETMASEWLEAAREKLHEEYYYYRLAGNTVIPPLATLYFLQFSSIAAADVFTLAEQLASVEAMRELSSLAHSEVIVIPSLNLKTYLLPAYDSPEEKFSQSLLRGALRGARYIQKIADQYRIEATKEAGINQFHAVLFNAALGYRCAHHIYSFLLSAPPEVLHEYENWGIDLKDLKKSYTLCEEMRVTILVSLSTTESSTSRNVLDRQQFGRWLTQLEYLDIAEAEHQIYDEFIKLMYPKFLRDLALGWIFLRHDDRFEKGVQLLLRTANLLETNQKSNDLQGEPDYLTGLYIELAAAFQRVGREEEAATYSLKSRERFVASAEEGPEGADAAQAS